MIYAKLLRINFNSTHKNGYRTCVECRIIIISCIVQPTIWGAFHDNCHGLFLMKLAPTKNQQGTESSENKGCAVFYQAFFLSSHQPEWCKLFLIIYPLFVLLPHKLRQLSLFASSTERVHHPPLQAVIQRRKTASPPDLQWGRSEKNDPPHFFLVSMITTTIPEMRPLSWLPPPQEKTHNTPLIYEPQAATYWI